MERHREHLQEEILLLAIVTVLFGAGRLTLLDRAGDWAGLRERVRIAAERFHKASGKIERQARDYIASLTADAGRFNKLICHHWGIENKLHWVLDVAFGEDLDRKRVGHAAQNFSLLNRIALNLPQQETSYQRSIRCKRLKATRNQDYMLK